LIPLTKEGEYAIIALFDFAAHGVFHAAGAMR
jgi:hypothetical protein